MSATYVLILLLSAYGSNGGNALAMQHFSTKEACDMAGQSAKTMSDTSRPITYRCVLAN